MFKSLFELESAAEVQAALKEKGVELSEEQIVGIRELLLKVESGEISVAQLENGELSEETLEYVAGGVVVASVIGAIIAVVSYAAAAAGGVASYHLITAGVAGESRGREQSKRTIVVSSVTRGASVVTGHAAAKWKGGAIWHRISLKTI